MFRAVCRMLSAVALPVVLLAACMSSEFADLRPLLAAQAFPVTQDDPPAGSETLGLVAVEDSGFYLFGVVPIVPMQFGACVDEIVLKARLLGADGIAHVVVSYRPPAFLRVVGLMLPDWFGYIGLTGSAWRMPRAEGETRPGPPRQ
jgi:hypothetical protein